MRSAVCKRILGKSFQSTGAVAEFQKNYGLVIREIDHNTTKLFVGNIRENCHSSDLRELFAKFGEVAECDIVKDYAFVHFYSADDAMVALEALDGTDFQGINLRVQLSHSRVRPKPGMGEREACYKCGRDGHWSKDCTAPAVGRGGGPPMRGAYHGGHDDGYYSGPGGRDYYLAAQSGGPPGAIAPPERYRPYDRRPVALPPPVPVPRSSAYAPRSDYAYPPADYYSSRTEHPDYYSSTRYGSSGYAPTSRDPPQTDALGRPPPEYYAHRLKDALYELIKDQKRVTTPSYDETRKGSTSSSGYY